MSTNNRFIGPHLPLALVSQSISSFLDTPIDTVSRRIQQDRRLAQLHARARAAHVPAPVAAAAEDEHDHEEPETMEDTVHPIVLHAALPDMPTTDMHKFVTARIIRAITRLAYASRESIVYVSMRPLIVYQGTLGQSCMEEAAVGPHIKITKLSTGWSVYFHEFLFCRDNLERLLPFIYPPPHEPTDAIPGISKNSWMLMQIPSEGLADAIAVCIAPRVRPGYVVAEYQMSKYVRVYDVQTDDWDTVYQS
jgi:hypothetical protein